MSTGAVRELCIAEHTKVPAVDKTRAGECHGSILRPILWHLRLCCFCPRPEPPFRRRTAAYCFPCISSAPSQPWRQGLLWQSSGAGGAREHSRLPALGLQDVRTQLFSKPCHHAYSCNLCFPFLDYGLVSAVCIGTHCAKLAAELLHRS